MNEGPLAQMSAPELDSYETLLNENDQDLYQWVTGQAEAPRALTGLIDQIAALVDARR